MNAGTASSSRRWGAGVAVAALAGIAVLAAACGGSSSPALTAQTAYQKALSDRRRSGADHRARTAGIGPRARPGKLGGDGLQGAQASTMLPET
jgi:hypothetical protein